MKKIKKLRNNKTFKGESNTQIWTSDYFLKLKLNVLKKIFEFRSQTLGPQENHDSFVLICRLRQNLH